MVGDFVAGNDTRVVEGKRGREGSAVHADLEEKRDREEVAENDAIEEKMTMICLLPAECGDLKTEETKLSLPEDPQMSNTVCRTV